MSIFSADYTFSAHDRHDVVPQYSLTSHRDDGDTTELEEDKKSAKDSDPTFVMLDDTLRDVRRHQEEKLRIEERRITLEEKKLALELKEAEAKEEARVLALWDKYTQLMQSTDPLAAKLAAKLGEKLAALEGL